MSLKRAVWAILLIVLVLPSCARAPSPQETSVPATTEVPTATPTQIPPTDTPVPTQVPPTETRVIIEYPTCSAETWMKCYIHPQELGIYGDYFNSLDKYSNPNLPTPDPNKVEIVYRFRTYETV